MSVFGLKERIEGSVGASPLTLAYENWKATGRLGITPGGNAGHKEGEREDGKKEEGR